MSAVNQNWDALKSPSMTKAEQAELDRTRSGMLNSAQGLVGYANSAQSQLGQGVTGLTSQLIGAGEMCKPNKTRGVDFQLREITNGFVVRVSGKEYFCKELSDVGPVICSAWAGVILGE